MEPVFCARSGRVKHRLRGPLETPRGARPRWTSRISGLSSPKLSPASERILWLFSLVLGHGGCSGAASCCIRIYRPCYAATSPLSRHLGVRRARSSMIACVMCSVARMLRTATSSTMPPCVSEHYRTSRKRAEPVPDADQGETSVPLRTRSSSSDSFRNLEIDP